MTKQDKWKWKVAIELNGGRWVSLPVIDDSEENAIDLCHRIDQALLTDAKFYRMTAKSDPKKVQTSIRLSDVSAIYPYKIDREIEKAEDKEKTNRQKLTASQLKYYNTLENGEKWKNTDEDNEEEDD